MKELTRSIKKMTYKEKLEAIDFKIELMKKHSNRCEYCHVMYNNDSLELAHIVPKHKNFIIKYGAEAIHHPLNLKLTCKGCNHKAMKEVAKSDYARDKHFKPIYADLAKKGYNVQGGI